MPDSSKPPAVSIILPTYNRASFLPEALSSIRAQTWEDWELIVVDDGSSDGTAEVVRERTAGWSQPVRYVYQENQGVAGARNTGLDLATGRYIAFYDSDDLWLPHHLRRCVEALDAHPQVDWVFGACRIIELESGRVLAPTTFEVDGRPRPFRRLQGRRSGDLFIIQDPEATRCQILHGLYCGLQNSLIRRRLFEGYRFDRQAVIGEDQILVITMLARGATLAYYEEVHVLYRTHESNSSLGARDGRLDKQLRVQTVLIQQFEKLLRSGLLGPRERRALKKRLGREYFWLLGYALLWQNGRRSDALAAFRMGLAYWPWDWRYWKTYALAHLRYLCQPSSV